MKCAFKAAAGKITAAVTGTNPFPDAVRANSPTGRRMASQWVMDFLTSDAGLHQFRQDLTRAGTAVTDKTNWIDAIGNMGNAIAARQEREATEYLRPIEEAMRRSMEVLDINDFAARKEVEAKVGRYRTIMHSIERYSMFRLEKATFVTEEKEARAARKEIMKKVAAGELTGEQYVHELSALADKHGLKHEHDALYTDMLTKLAAEVETLESDEVVQQVYADSKQFIDRAFDRIIEINKASGLITDEVVNQIKARGFEHYTPMRKSEDLARMTEADFFEGLSPSALAVAQELVVDDTLPVFVSLHTMLNGAAKNFQENAVAQKMWSFTKEHGESWGMKVGAGREVYTLGDKGYNMSTGMRTVPPHAVPYYNNGKMYLIHFDGSEENKQLFSAVKNRFAQNFTSAQNKIGKAAGKVTHTTARLFTNFNPQFWFNSFVRDPTAAMLNVAIDPRIKDKPATLKRMAELMVTKFNHKAAQQYYLTRHTSRNAISLGDVGDKGILADFDQIGVQSEFAEWARRLAKLGGESTFNRAFYFSDYAGQSDTENTTSVFNLGGTLGGVDSARRGSQFLGHELLRVTGDMVAGFDMQARVSVFRALIEQGYDDVEAAAITREFMDFSQRGLDQNGVSNVVPFFRTSAAAAYRTVESLFYDAAGNVNKEGIKSAAIMIAIGMMASMAGRGDQDDDGVYQGDKVSLSKWMSTMPLGFDENGNALSVPLPYGVGQIFVGLGLGMGRIRDTGASAEDVVGVFAVSLARNVVPLNTQYTDAPQADPGDVLASTLTHAIPIVGTATDVYANKTIFGSAIHNEGGPAGVEGTEAYLQGRDDTPEVLKGAARYLFEYSGGVIDAYPETIQFVLEQYLGGVVRPITGELEREYRRDLGSTDPNDWQDGWSRMVGAPITDRSPAFYDHAQYKKAMALAATIENRQKAGMEITPDDVAYFKAVSEYVRARGTVNAAMRDVTPEQRYQLVLKRREIEKMIGRVAIRNFGKPTYELESPVPVE